MSIFDLSPEEFAALSMLLGFSLLPGLTTDQQNSLGNFLMGVGQVLETAAAQQAVSKDNRSDERMDALEVHLNHLEKRLAALEKTAEQT